MGSTRAASVSCVHAIFGYTLFKKELILTFNIPYKEKSI